MEPQSNVEPSTEKTASPAVRFASLTFSDGTTIRLDRNDVVVFVEPNNAGKSAALHELEQHVGSTTSRTIVKSVSLQKVGTADELRAFLKEHGEERIDRFVGTPL